MSTLTINKCRNNTTTKNNNNNDNNNNTNNNKKRLRSKLKICYREIQNKKNLS